MRPVKNKRRIDPRYFLDETTERDTLEETESVPGSEDDDEKHEGKEHDKDCGCSKCSKKKKGKKKDDNGREVLFGEDEGDKN